MQEEVLLERLGSVYTTESLEGRQNKKLQVEGCKTEL